VICLGSKRLGSLPGTLPDSNNYVITS